MESFHSRRCQETQTRTPLPQLTVPGRSPAPQTPFSTNQARGVGSKGAFSRSGRMWHLPPVTYKVFSTSPCKPR
jgi:hypothetical protein